MPHAELNGIRLYYEEEGSGPPLLLIAGLGANRLSQAALTHAQRAAQRLAYRQRRNVLQMDTWLEEALSFSGPGAEF